MEWIDIKCRRPSSEDSPILAIDSLEHFSTRALQYIDGWDGPGWYDASEEHGMGLEERKAHFNEYSGMKYWMPLPVPPKSD